MLKLQKFKIEKLVKFSNPVDFICGDNNFKISKEPTSTLDINKLFRKNIYPFGFDFKNKRVIFVETKKDIPHNDTPFLYRLLQQEAEYIIHVPFIVLQNVVSDHVKDNNFLFIHHPSRCGSTLLHHIIGSNPYIESFSEDLILDNLIWWIYHENIDFDEIKSIYTCILHLLMIKCSGDLNNKIISLKMCSHSHYYISIISRILPNSSHIYLTRNPVEIAFSHENYMRMMEQLMDFDQKPTKSELLSYFDLDFIHGDMVEKGDYGQFVTKYIPSEIKSTLGAIDNIERNILRVILIDSFFYSRKYKKMLYLTYNEILNKDILFNRLLRFLRLDKNSYFHKKEYEEHSQSGIKFKGANKKYFKPTKEEIRKYTSFAENVYCLINSSTPKHNRVEKT